MKTEEVARKVIDAYRYEDLFWSRNLKRLIMEPKYMGLQCASEVSEAIQHCIDEECIGAACLVAYFCAPAGEVSDQFFEKYQLYDSHCAYIASKFYSYKDDELGYRKLLKISCDMGNVYAYRELMIYEGNYSFLASVRWYFRRLYAVITSPTSPDTRSMI